MQGSVLPKGARNKTVRARGFTMAKGKESSFIRSLYQLRTWLWGSFCVALIIYTHPVPTFATETTFIVVNPLHRPGTDSKAGEMGLCERREAEQQQQQNLLSPKRKSDVAEKEKIGLLLLIISAVLLD